MLCKFKKLNRPKQLITVCLIIILLFGIYIYSKVLFRKVISQNRVTVESNTDIVLRRVWI
jgi:hypothetical protein